MTVLFDKAFLQSVNKLSNIVVERKVERVIIELEHAETVLDVRNAKKLKGFKNYFRIRLGDFRLGFELLSKSTVRFIVVAHRKEIYRMFP